ncbi:MAG: hypothetical protein QNL12_04710 [Acidimicrobiia bacterium]|nr:hypothetical protein [Acidimicrobiia bacterium]MDX2466593.1 hypothetical protein [Acidimicrobiia bacterium]
MVNLTLAIDKETLKRSRIRALEQGTSVNAVVRDYLEVYAGVDRRQSALSGFVDLARAAESGGSGSGRAWTRDGLYESDA